MRGAYAERRGRRAASAGGHTAQTLLIAARENPFENASTLEAPGLKTLRITLAQMGLTKYFTCR